MAEPAVTGLCECGCGERTALAAQSYTRKGVTIQRGAPARFRPGHHARVEAYKQRPLGPLNGRWRGGRWPSTKINPYVRIYRPQHPRATAKGYVFEHLLVAERALGRPIPVKHPIHHVNEVCGDNRPGNLVICEDKAYHRLLHRRTAALRATGNPRARRCYICDRWILPDDPDWRQYGDGTSAYHGPCGVLRRRCYEESRRG